MKNIKKKSQINLIWDIDALPIKFPSKIRDTYEKIYLKNRKNYTNLIDQIGKKYSDNIDWWMTLPSYRSPYASNILNYLCIIDTLRILKFTSITLITSSKVFGKLITKNFKNSNIEVKIKPKNSGFFPIFKNFFKSTIYQLFIFLFIKILKKKEKFDNRKIVLIDKFITLRETQNLGYFPEFNNSKNIKIVPTFIPTLNIFNLIKIFSYIKKNPRKYIYKEQYLSFEDLCFSFSHIFRRRQFLKNKYYYKKFDLSEVIYDELNYYDDFYSINNGLLNYKFFYRLSENNINIYKSFNWFENQIIDKGWNYGFRKYFPQNQLNSFGYQDFNKHFNLLSNSPSKLEKTCKVIPNKIIIISKFFKKITNEFNKNQKLIIGQSQRFKKLTKIKLIPFKNRKKILIILSGIKKIDKELISMAIKTCEISKKTQIYVKPHPILNIDDIISKKILPINMILYDGDLKKILMDSLITITAGPSSALLESVSFGSFNILPKIECGTLYNAQIFNLKKNEYSLVNNSRELKNKIDYILKNKTNIKVKKRLIIKQNSVKITNLLN